MKSLKALAAAVTLAVVGGTAANAALLDFTDKNVGLTGTFAGTSYSVTGFPVAPNRNQAFDGIASDVRGVSLALDNDGLGLRDDEISFPREHLDVSFGRDVRVTALYFLDLFVNARDGSDRERAIISVDGEAGVFFQDGMQAKAGNNSGFADRVGSLRGSTFRFTAGSGNDQFARPDYALAALEVEPVPIPAAGLLLVAGLGALGLLKRRSA